MHPYLRYAIERQRDIVALTGELVRAESPSGDRHAMERFMRLVAERTADIAVSGELETGGPGPNLLLTFQLPQTDTETREQLLALGHGDTVWPLGTIEEMPFREENGRLWGPGVLDMKAGLTCFIFAMRLLRDLQTPVSKRVRLLVVNDEEVGSRGSRELTVAEAKKSRAVLVLEPGTGLTGKLKTARKGVGVYRIAVKGRAAHAGVDFAAGASAIHELARQIEIVSAWTDLARGTTVNVGVIRGGTRSNVIAAEAEAEVDVRVVTLAEAARIDRLFGSLRPLGAGCEIGVSGGLNRPPMERSAAIGDLFGRAREIASELGIELEESATGGGSDGNFTAAAGVGTLDGLGAIGEGAHGRNESVLADRLADRTALLAALAARL